MTRELVIHDFDVERIVRRQLRPGEQLLWSGRPGQGVRVRHADRWAIPFTFGWLAIVFFVFLSNPTLSDSASSLIAMTLLLVGGIFMAIVRIPLDALIRANTAYAVTDRRVLFIAGVLFREVRSLPFEEIPAITLSERGDSEGDVVLDSRDMSHVAVGGFVPKGETVPDAFEFVSNARHVYEVVRAAHRDALTRPQRHRPDLRLYPLLRWRPPEQERSA